VRPNGTLAVCVRTDSIDLDFATRSNLVLITEELMAVEEAGVAERPARACICWRI